MTLPAPARPWRAIVVDDEPPARATLRMLLAREPDFELVSECGHGEEALAVLARQPADVLFLDVRMPGLDGFDVLASMPGDAPLVIFVTAYDRYAPRAFESHAVEYLLKPFSDERFAVVLDHVRARLRERTYAALGARLPAALLETAARPERRRLVIRDGARTHVIAHDDIVWIEAEDYYVRIHAGGRRVLARESLRTLTATLDPGVFARVHRSAIVNTRRIRAIEPLASGDQRLLLEDGTSLRVSRTHRAALMRLLDK